MARTRLGATAPLAEALDQAVVQTTSRVRLSPKVVDEARRILPALQAARAAVRQGQDADLPTSPGAPAVPLTSAAPPAPQPAAATPPSGSSPAVGSPPLPAIKRRPSAAVLARRETQFKEMIDFIREGKTIGEMAQAMGVSYWTVRRLRQELDARLREAFPPDFSITYLRSVMQTYTDALAIVWKALKSAASQNHYDACDKYARALRSLLKDQARLLQSVGILRQVTPIDDDTQAAINFLTGSTPSISAKIARHRQVRTLGLKLIDELVAAPRPDPDPDDNRDD